ncbi:hypothetical protein MKW92_053656 [Papaver armeniacum]|nr:hypothetical protein MKW92_053656 [Papaver armeniacum]
MAAAVELKESTTGGDNRVNGYVLDFPTNFSCDSSPVKIPRRVKQRLMESKSPSVTTFEDIQAKLKEADHRRQQFHESSQEDALAQKLEAKLIAAEHKRLSILARARKRLAKLDERRQAAKTGAELRYEKEREKLGTKVESRVQQAEENRMLLLKARRQRRAAVKERRDQSLLQRMVQESKYKRVCTCFNLPKRAAAEKKRLGLLEAEKRRTHARLMQVKRVAKFVNHQREIQRRRIKDQLEDRLQRAKSQRAEYLRQRKSSYFWCWRRFVQLKRTTYTLAKGYDALQIKGNLSNQSLLDRFETRFRLSHSNASLTGPSKGRPSSSRRKGGLRNMGSSVEATQNQAMVSSRYPMRSRYPVRVVLSAFMILGHPDVVLSGHGEREFLLAESAGKFVQELEMLIKVVLDGWTKSGSKLPDQTFRSQLEAFDAAWCSYLYRFVVWKFAKDQRLLRERVQHLSGDAGIKRMESALSDTRSRFFEAKENGSPMDTPVAHILSPSLAGSSAALPLQSGSEEVEVSQGYLGACEKPSRVVLSLFKDTSSSPSAEAVLSTTSKSGDSRWNLLQMKNWPERMKCLSMRLSENRHAFASKVRETMENAFWDGIAESMKQDDPDYDVDILTQVLMSGTRDMDYLGKILQFALVTLQKLSAAATEDEMKETHKNLLKDVGVASSGSFIESMIKGLRFVLQEIQIMEPIIKGPGGLEYLKKAFGGRYGSPSNVSTSLPLTVRWLSSVIGSAEEEWEEHKDSLAALMASQPSTSQGLPPSTSLKTGGNVPTSSDKFQPTFYPQVSTTIDVLVRLGLLKLVSKIEGINNENLPETLKLNFPRLRSIQSQLQKIISLLSKTSYINPSSMEYIVTNSVKAVTELLDSVEDVGIIEIVEKFYEFMEGYEDAEKLQASKEVMANMLLKSLRAGDTVFERVSRAVYVAVRSAVLCGTVAHGRNLAETVLRVGAAFVLVDRVIEMADVLIIVAKVSGDVHGEWYLQLVNNV